VICLLQIQSSITNNEIDSTTICSFPRELFTVTKVMKVKINGEEREIKENINLTELLKVLKLPSERLAVEVNLNVVRRLNWEETRLNEGDKIEIIHFVGGG
jgi:sulfur carrier protein